MIYALLTSFLFSTIGVLTHYLYNYDISANVSFFSSSLISCIFLFFVLLIKYKNFSFLKLNTKKDIVATAIYAGLFCLFAANILVLLSLKFIDSGMQRLLTSSNPIFIILINFLFLKQKISKNSLITIALMLTGLFLIVGNVELSGDNVVRGLIYALSAGIFVAVYSVLAEKENNISDGLVYWFYGFLFSTIYSIINLFIQGESINILFLPDIKFHLLLLSLALLNFTFPYIFFLKSISTIGAEKTGIVTSSTIVMSMFFAYFVLNENITFTQFIGIIFVVAASVLSGIRKK